MVSLCALFYACVVAHSQVPIHYANFQLEVDPRPVPVPAGAEEGQPQEQRQEQREEQRQEQRQEQQEGLEVDVDVVVDWDVPAVPEPADFGDALHSPDKFLKVTSAEATAVHVVDGGGMIISRLFQAQVIRRGFGTEPGGGVPVLGSGAGEGGGATMGCLRCALCAGAPPLHAQPAPPPQH